MSKIKTAIGPVFTKAKIPTLKEWENLFLSILKCATPAADQTNSYRYGQALYSSNPDFFWALSEIEVKRGLLQERIREKYEARDNDGGFLNAGLRKIPLSQITFENLCDESLFKMRGRIASFVRDFKSTLEHRGPSLSELEYCRVVKFIAQVEAVIQQDASPTPVRNSRTCAAATGISACSPA